MSSAANDSRCFVDTRGESACCVMVMMRDDGGDDCRRGVSDIEGPNSARILESASEMIL